MRLAGAGADPDDGEEQDERPADEGRGTGPGAVAQHLLGGAPALHHQLEDRREGDAPDVRRVHAARCPLVCAPECPATSISRRTSTSDALAVPEVSVECLLEQMLGEDESRVRTSPLGDRLQKGDKNKHERYDLTSKEDVPDILDSGRTW